MKKKILIAVILVALLGGVVFLFSQNGLFIKPPVAESFYIGNLHTHTEASDGKMTYNEVITEAQRLGFNFIAITDHNTISPDTKEFCPKETRILCITGEEVSTKKGHMLAIGIKEAIPKDLSPEETIIKIHEQGGLAIPAHPGASNGLTIGKIKELPVDAVECSIRHQKEGEKYDCESLPNVPHVYNSDAHKKEELSRAANKCLMKELTFENLAEAVKDNHCFNFYGK
jgi:predicted metal-dependent phosphoesterase TrpH